ncbi:MAG: DoxX family protein [Cellvibrionaceae bacterium]
MMNHTYQPAYAASLLRLTLGIVLLAHSLYLKLFIYTLPGTAEAFASLGLPPALAYVVFAIEVISGISLIIGFNTRLFCLLSFPILLGATWAHYNNGWLFTNTGGGWEYPLVLSIMLIIQVLLGNGAYAITQDKN